MYQCVSYFVQVKQVLHNPHCMTCKLTNSNIYREGLSLILHFSMEHSHVCKKLYHNILSTTDLHRHHNLETYTLETLFAEYDWLPMCHTAKIICQRCCMSMFFFPDLDGTGSVAHFLKLQIFHCMNVCCHYLLVQQQNQLLYVIKSTGDIRSYVLQSVIDMNNASFLKSTEASSSLS